MQCLLYIVLAAASEVKHLYPARFESHRRIQEGNRGLNRMWQSHTSHGGERLGAFRINHAPLKVGPVLMAQDAVFSIVVRELGGQLAAVVVLQVVHTLAQAVQTQLVLRT